MESPAQALRNAMAEVAALPSYLRTAPLSCFRKDELVIAARKLRAQLKEVEDEICRRP